MIEILNYLLLTFQNVVKRSVAKPIDYKFITIANVIFKSRSNRDLNYIFIRDHDLKYP